MKKQIQIIGYIFFAVILISFRSAVFAASLNLEAPTIDLQPGDRFELVLALNAENENLNAISGTISFDRNQISPREIRDGQSIVSFWVDRPAIGDTQNNIIFSGLIPGGYDQDGARIFSVIFEVQSSLKPGQLGAITINNPVILLNDGKGSAAKTTVNSYYYQIVDSKRLPLVPEKLEDKIPPEEFSAMISRSEDVFDNKWYLSFGTQDKQSGVDHYEVREGRFGSFKEGNSPYLLQDQKLQSRIYVKAVDKAGNERVVKIEAENPRGIFENPLTYAIIAVVIALLFYLKQKNKIKKIE